VVQRLHGTLAAKPVKAPEEQAVELTPGCRGEHLPKLVTVTVLAASPVLVLLNYRPTLRGREPPKLAELVLCVLPSIFGGNSCIYRCSHHCHPLVPKTNVICVDRNLGLNPTPNELARRPLIWYSNSISGVDGQEGNNLREAMLQGLLVGWSRA